MKKLLLILLCLPIIGFGQFFEQTWYYSNTSGGRSVQQTSDGGFIITGSGKSTTATGNPNVFLKKTDGNGIEQWSYDFGNANLFQSGCSVQQTTDGGYIIAGVTTDIAFGPYVVLLIKTDGSGTEQWTKTLAGISSQGGYSVQQTTDGGYIITGYALDVTFGSTNVLLIKTDANGIEQWSQTFGGTGNDEGHSVQQTTDGGYIITGYTSTFGNGSYDVYLIKTDGSGIEQWSQTFGGTGNDEGYSVQQTTDGGYIITGYAESFGNGDDDVYLIKTDGSGIEQWTNNFEGMLDRGHSVQQTTDGGYIITGQTVDNLGKYGIILLKTDTNGIYQWFHEFTGSGFFGGIGYSVQQTNDGGYVLTGIYISTSIFLIKTNGNGNITSLFNIPINPNRKLEKTVDILGKQTKPQTNIPFIEIYDDGTVEKRIVIE